jgi:hypothetical protein
MWKRADLVKATQKQRDEQKSLHPKIQRAALAYARYMNLTEERGIDPEEAKAELDVLIDEITILDLWEDHEKLTVQIHRDLAMYKEQRETQMLGQSRTLDELKSQADLSMSVTTPDGTKAVEAQLQREHGRIQKETEARERLGLTYPKKRKGMSM